MFLRIPVPPDGCTCIKPTQHLARTSYSFIRSKAAPLWRVCKANPKNFICVSRKPSTSAIKYGGSGRRRRRSRRLIGYWPCAGGKQQQDSTWKLFLAAEGTKCGCRTHDSIWTGALERSATRLQGTFVTFERYTIFKLQDVT